MSVPGPDLTDQLVSERTGPVLRVASLPVEPWQPPGHCVGAAGVAVDRAHEVTREASGLGHADVFAAARDKALHEFTERLVLSEPPIEPARGASTTSDGCPLGRLRLTAESLTTGAVVSRPRREWFLHPPACPEARRPDRPSTNGAAAGGSPAEATERALLELLERDAVMTTWRYGLRWPGWRPDPTIAGRLAALEAHGFSAAFTDLSPIHGVPTVLCVAGNDTARASFPARTVGSAADRTMSRAAKRALDEATRVLGTLLSDPGEVPDPDVPYYENFLDNARTYLAPERLPLLDALAPQAAAGDAAPTGGTELRGTSADVVTAVACGLRRRGIEVLAADLTPPWLRGMNVHIVVARSHDLYPLEAGAGDPVLAERLDRHPCRSAWTKDRPPNLAPVPLA